MFLVLKSYTFLAPLSHPIFGSEMVPEPRREENHGIDRVFVITVLYIPGTPVGSDFWRRKCSGAQTEGKSWNLYVFDIKTHTFLAPLSDPIFGSEMAPEPKWEENH